MLCKHKGHEWDAVQWRSGVKHPDVKNWIDMRRDEDKMSYPTEKSKVDAQFESCSRCGQFMREHGLLGDKGHGGFPVCPGSWVMTRIESEFGSEIMLCAEEYFVEKKGRVVKTKVKIGRMVPVY